MIKTLTLSNFQKHKQLVLAFDKGVNVLRGETDAGKSAIIRAIILTLFNSPRGGEKTYLHEGATEPLEVTIQDFNGNTIRRVNRTYTINDKNVLTAFNQEKPEAVAEIIRFNEVNFQRQIEPHFLILETGGNAAKILNSVTGMEDQMLLLSEIKSRMVGTRREYMDLNAEKEALNKTTTQLATVPLFIKRLDSIEESKSTLDVTWHLIEKLDELLSKTIIVHNESIKFAFLDDLEKKFLKIFAKATANYLTQKAIESLTQVIYQIIHGRKKMEEYQDLHRVELHVSTVHKFAIQTKHLTDQIKKLTMMIKVVMEKEQTYQALDFEIDGWRSQFDALLVQSGKCPLCGAISKKGGHSC
jgi:DNA repair exonuclease SbcCD ATPase subunit